MNVKKARKVPRYWWLALPLLCLVPCAIDFTDDRHDPKGVIAQIPVGSKLSELDKHLVEFSHSEVYGWVSERPADSSWGSKQTKYGSFYVRKLGEYDAWTASKADRDAFTGELSFYHLCWIIPDDIAPSYVLDLVYVDGVLKEKEYGHLPG